MLLAASFLSFCSTVHLWSACLLTSPIVPLCRALSLGVVSKRRVYSEAAAILSQQPEQPWPAGFGLLSQLAWLLTSSGGAAPRLRRQRKAAAAAAAAEARDFHEQMAAGREGQQAYGATLHHWRWQGLITDYLAAPAAQGEAGVGDQSTRPAILLCHGFGAFSGGCASSSLKAGL